LEIPQEIWTDSVPGKLYELHVNYNGSTANELELAKQLSSGLSDKFGATLKYMEISNGQITVQLEGSPFAWSAVAAWLPSVLGLFGLVLIAIALFTVLFSIPSWAWGLLAVGGILIVVPPILMRGK
jgi:hypothetical protein